jgi:hypothetical protein
MRKRVSRKLLVASLGVAAVSYVACGRTDTVSTGGDGGVGDGATKDGQAFDQLVANLVVPPQDATSEELVANLVAPPEDASLTDAGNG